jgi:hypothetical protein
MANKAIAANDIPDWFLQTVRVMQDTEHGVRSIETELCYAMGLDGLDPRLHDELQYVRNALGTVKVSLSMMDLSAGQVLLELVKPASPEPAQVAVVGS